MKLPCLMPSRCSKQLTFCALCVSLFSSQALFAQSTQSKGIAPADSLADVHRRAFVAATLHNARGEYGEAAHRYRQLLSAQPSNAAIHYALSNAYVGLGMLDSARVHGEKSVQLNPDNHSYAQLLSGITQEINRFNQEVALYRQRADSEQGEEKEKLLFTLGKLSMQTAHYELASTTFRELLYHNPLVLSAWLALFECDVLSGNNGVFRDDLARFYASSQATENQQLELTRLFVMRASRNGAYVEPAHAMLDSLYHRTPNNPRSLLPLRVMEGELHLQRGNVTKAIDVLEKVTRPGKDPQERWLYRQAKNTLALCYEKSGQMDKSLRIYEHLVRLEPGNALAMNNLAYTLVLQGKSLFRAHTLARKAVAQEPENASYLDTLGWILFKTRRYQQAQEMLEKAMHLNPDEIEIMEHLRQVYEKRGFPVKASEMQERIKRRTLR